MHKETLEGHLSQKTMITWAGIWQMGSWMEWRLQYPFPTIKILLTM